MPILLASQVGLAQSLAVDATRLYWANSTAGTISSCVKAGCSQPFATIAFNQVGADHLVLDGQELYWTTSDGNIARCAVTDNCGPDPTILSTVQYNTSTLAVLSGQAYWNTLHAIITCSVGSCSATQTTIVSGAIQPLNLAVDATTVFWSDLGSGGNNETLISCPVSGCASGAVLASGLTGIGIIALTGTDVYWAANTGPKGTLLHCPKTGCTGEPQTAGVSDLVGSPAFLIDGNDAYWATTDIVRCAGLACAGGAQVLATGQDPATLVADDTTLYWSDLSKGSIFALSPK